MAHCGCDPELEVSPGPPFSFSLFFGSGFYVSPCLQLERFSLLEASLSGPGSGVGLCRELGHGPDPLIHN